MLDAQLLEKLAISIVAGLFGIVPVLLQALSVRSQARGRNNEVARLAAELEFLVKLDALAQAQPRGNAASPSPVVSVQPDLVRILADYRATRLRDVGAGERAKEPGFVSRLFLLYRPATGKAWLVHTAFYFLVIFGVFVLALDYQSPTFDPETGENEFKYLVLGLAVLLGLPLLLLRRAALRLRTS